MAFLVSSNVYSFVIYRYKTSFFPYLCFACRLPPLLPRRLPFFCNRATLSVSFLFHDRTSHAIETYYCLLYDRSSPSLPLPTTISSLANHHHLPYRSPSPPLLATIQPSSAPLPTVISSGPLPLPTTISSSHLSLQITVLTVISFPADLPCQPPSLPALLPCRLVDHCLLKSSSITDYRFIKSSSPVKHRLLLSIVPTVKKTSVDFISIPHSGIIL
ncbi:hypothetical protein ACLOJK_010396 [Asimina triloba]